MSINDNKAYVPKLFYDDIYLIDQLWYFVKVNDKWALRYGYDIDKNYTVFETLHDKIDDVYISNIMNRDEKLMCYKSIDNGMESIFLMKIGKFDNVKYLSEQIVPYVKKILCVAIDSKYNMAYAYLDDNGKLNLKTGTIENAWKSKDMGKGFDQGTVYYLIPDIKEKNFLRVGSSLMDYRSAEKVVIQKELVDTCDGISNMLWGDKGRKLAIKAKFGNKYAVLINNDKGPLYDDIGEIIFSPDGKHFSYSAKSGDKWFVVVDGKIGQNFSEAVNLVYNKESTCLVYMVKHNESDDKYGSSKYKPNDLWGVVINDYHSTDVYVNKFFTKPIFDNEKELHFISGKYLTTTAQEKRQEYAVELNNCKIEMIEIKENEPVKPENKIQ